MFVEVNHKDLVVGEKYMIKTNNFVNAYHIGKFTEHVGWACQLFENVIFFYGSIKIEQGYMYMESSPFKKLVYYAFIPKKEQIQQAMEKRALDKILNRIVNDDFSW